MGKSDGNHERGLFDAAAAERGLEVPDLLEYGGLKDGTRQRSSRRLFMHFRAFRGAASAEPLAAALAASDFEAVLYEDVNDPKGVGLLVFSEDPEVLAGPVRRFLATPPFAALRYLPDFTMLGRTYALGYEPDLEDVLLHRPRRTVLNDAWPWAVFYPLRRTGSFARLPEEERRSILKEHGTIGMSFGRADLVHDVRLACHGLDVHDNDFVVGLVGKELFPLSAVVETMRATVQTSQYIERLGPFFIGRAVLQQARTAR